LSVGVLQGLGLLILPFSIASELVAKVGLAQSMLLSAGGGPWCFTQDMFPSASRRRVIASRRLFAVAASELRNGQLALHDERRTIREVGGDLMDGIRFAVADRLSDRVQWIVEFLKQTHGRTNSGDSSMMKT